jgi:ATP-dependent RNA helicase RhlE
LLRALDAAKLHVPTPIQARTIPALLQGRDVLGHRPDRHRQDRGLRAARAAAPRRPEQAGRAQEPAGLVSRRPASSRSRSRAASTPTDAASAFASAPSSAGSGYARQIETLQRGVDILVATPGRLLDLIERGNVKLGHVTFFVLDEADRMFDMGFIRDVRRIVGAVSKQRQTLCSPPPCRATSPSWRRRS